MGKITLPLLSSEFAKLAPTLKKAASRDPAFKVEVGKDRLIKSSVGGAVVEMHEIELSIGDLPSGEILFKDTGSYRSLSRPFKRQQEPSRSKFIVMSESGEFSPLKLNEFSSDVQAVFNKISSTFQDRGKSLNRNSRVETNVFLQNCEAILSKFFYINKGVDSINSTSEAAYNFSLYGSAKGYKHEHWVKNLNTGEVPLRSVENIRGDIAEVLSKNPTISAQDVELLNSVAVDADGASRLAGLVESSLLKTSISLGSEFSANPVFDVSREPISLKGEIFSIGQMPKMGGGIEYEMRIKTSEGALVKVLSGSENFGGLISKPQLIECVSSGLEVSVTGVVISTTKEMKITPTRTIPASTNIKADSLSFESAPRLSSQLKLSA